MRREARWEVSVQGPASAVLLLHGGAGPASLQSTADHLASEHRTLTPTHPGWGAAPRPPGLDSVSALAREYLDLMDDRDISTCILVGSSFGGWVATEMAVQDDRGRIDGLVLMDAIGPMIPRPSAPPSPAGMTDAQRRGMQLIGAYSGGSMGDATLLERARTVEIPVLVLWGENDPVVPVSYGQEYAAAFSTSAFEVVPDAGHIPALDNPAMTFEAIDRFISTVQAARHRGSHAR